MTDEEVGGRSRFKYLDHYSAFSKTELLSTVDIVGNPCRQDEVGSITPLLRYPLTSQSDSQTVPRNHQNLVQPPWKADATGLLSFQLCWMSVSNCFLMNNFSDLRETSKKNIALRSEVVRI